VSVQDWQSYSDWRAISEYNERNRLVAMFEHGLIPRSVACRLLGFSEEADF